MEEAKKRLKVYCETSFWSYLNGGRTPLSHIAVKQAFTRQWWQDIAPSCEIYVSQYVEEESRDGNAEFADHRLASMTESTWLDGTLTEVLSLADLLLGEDVFAVDRGMGSYMRMDGHVTMTGLLPVGDCFMTTGAALPYHGTNADMLPMLDAVGASPHTPITLTVPQRADFAAWSIVTARAFGEMDRVRYA